MKYTWTNLISLLNRLQNYNNPKNNDLPNIDGLSLTQLRGNYILKCVQSEKCYLIDYQKNTGCINVHSLICDTEFHIPTDMDDLDEAGYTLANGRLPEDLRFIMDSLIKLGV